MPLSSTTVGIAGEPLVHEIDARWTMAYAAGLGDTLPCYLDTQLPEGIIAHPLFPVCFEWPVVVATRQQPANPLTADEFLRGVHATHHVVIHRLVRPGDRLTTRATIASVERRTPGAYQVVRLDTTDAAGESICTTWYGTLYRGVSMEGPDRPAMDAPVLLGPIESDMRVRAEVSVPIPVLAAHIYTECARIWNPIHTDMAVAVGAGLPGLILHGTATLALAVSQIIGSEAGNHPERVRQIAGRFGAMVTMPSEIIVRVLSRAATLQGDIVHFEVHNAEGNRAVRDGVVVLQV